MKKFCLLVLTLFAVLALQAQESPVSPDASQAKEKSEKPVKKLRYQTEIDLSYAYGIEDEISYLNLEWVNGVRFNRYFFAGFAGVTGIWTPSCTSTSFYYFFHHYICF